MNLNDKVKVPFTEKTPASLVLPFGWVNRTIFAGPYIEKPVSMFGIKLAPEVRGYAHVQVPIRDFGIPQDKGDVEFALRFALAGIANRSAVYVGCYGGKGRTGLFLSLLAKTLGVENPVEYVRANYREEAVETDQQYDYVGRFKPSLSVLDAARRAKVGAVMVDTFKFFGLTYWHSDGEYWLGDKR